MPDGETEKCENHKHETCETMYEEKEVNDVIKAIPNPDCKDSDEVEICMTVECPAIWANRTCEAKEVLDVQMVPKVILETFLLTY